MPPRIRRSPTPPRRPSTLPRLRLKMAAHSPPLSKRWACRGKRGRNSCGALSNILQLHLYFVQIVLWLIITLTSSPLRSTVMWACVGSVTREPEGRRCSPPATAPVRWGKCTRAAWRSGCRPPTPATVNSVTQNSLSNDDHNHSHRSEAVCCKDDWWKDVKMSRHRLSHK